MWITYTCVKELMFAAKQNGTKIGLVILLDKNKMLIMWDFDLRP